MPSHIVAHTANISILYILLTDNFVSITEIWMLTYNPMLIYHTLLTLLVFSHWTNPVPAFSHCYLVSLPSKLTCINDRLHDRTAEHTDALDSAIFIITHHSLFHIISNHCWFICFNLCLILSWDAGEDGLYGYWLSWLTTSHLWRDNLTYYVTVLLYHDVVSE